jgi:hypothetical protein
VQASLVLLGEVPGLSKPVKMSVSDSSADGATGASLVAIPVMPNGRCREYKQEDREIAYGTVAWHNSGESTVAAADPQAKRCLQT